VLSIAAIAACHSPIPSHQTTEVSADLVADRQEEQEAEEEKQLPALTKGHHHQPMRGHCHQPPQGITTKQQPMKGQKQKPQPMTQWHLEYRTNAMAAPCLCMPAVFLYSCQIDNRSCPEWLGRREREGLRPKFRSCRDKASTAHQKSSEVECT
jgi:hypothetical protein